MPCWKSADSIHACVCTEAYHPAAKQRGILVCTHLFASSPIQIEDDSPTAVEESPNAAREENPIPLFEIKNEDQDAASVGLRRALLMRGGWGKP